MTNQEKEQLEQTLQNSKFKMCADCVDSQVVVYVTEEHILICDKVYAKNQLIIPFSEFRQQYENYLNNGNSKNDE